VLLLGTRRGEFLPGDAELFDLEAMTFRLSRDASETEDTALGHGFLVTASNPASEIVYTVRLERSATGAGNGQLLRSADFGRTWQSVAGAPRGIIGAAFSSERSGYVWSSQRIFHTDDAGQTWSGVATPWRVARSRPRPIVDRAGSLWIARDGASVSDGPAVVRISAGLAAEPIRLTPLVQIKDWAFDPEGRLWLLAQSDRALGIRATQSEKGVLTLTEDFPLPSGESDFLWAGRSRVVAAITRPGFDGDVLKVLKRRGLWSTVELPEPRIRMYCADDQRIWLVGASGRVYAIEQD
jgi:hypothetical protein